MQLQLAIIAQGNLGRQTKVAGAAATFNTSDILISNGAHVDGIATDCQWSLRLIKSSVSFVSCPSDCQVLLHIASHVTDATISSCRHSDKGRCAQDGH